jgi:hypothetical protein
MYKQASISFNHLNTLIHYIINMWIMLLVIYFVSFYFTYSDIPTKRYRNEQIDQCNTKYGEEKHESSWYLNDSSTPNAC